MKVLIIEPFYGGSHKSLIDVLQSALQPEDYVLLTMPAKKWPWRARCSALYIAQNIPDLTHFTTLFCSSVLSLAELIGLHPAIARLKKIVYFHENQLIYPVQNVKDRDFQYGYNQITSCLAADAILFNSNFNKCSFLDNINKFLKIMPDFRVKNIPALIESKMSVSYFPLDFTMADEARQQIPQGLPDYKDISKPVHLVWPHRWEFDKNPALLFETLYSLMDDGIIFELSVLGECFSEEPPEFFEAKIKLKKHIKHFGYAESKQQYYEILSSSDLVISTADHEFFGVSVMEGVRCGCLPLVPNKLVYPELYPRECLYDSPKDMKKKLKYWCQNPDKLVQLRQKLNLFHSTEKFSVQNIVLKNILPMFENN